MCDRLINAKMAKGAMPDLYKMYKKENEEFLSYFKWRTPEWLEAKAELEALFEDNND